MAKICYFCAIFVTYGINSNFNTMRKVSFLLLFFVVTMFAQAQVATNIYWVQFTDKANSPYSIDNPEAYLSARALQRRANQGIGIDEYDIPVNPQYLQAVADCGAQLLNPSKWLNGVSAAQSFEMAEWRFGAYNQPRCD